MASTSAALDEVSFARPDIIQWWVSEGGQPMDENMIHRYFSESPFFDWGSKNGLFMQQAGLNFEMHMMSRNRKDFESALKESRGVEYIIVGEPQPVADKTQAAQGMKTGIWTIRKQDRQPAPLERYLRPPGVLQDGEWDLTILGTYFIVGENVFQAPSVGDIVGNRLLSATTHMSKFYELASALPRFTPSNGYSYLPAAAKQTSTNALPAVSPSQSRQGSVAPAGDSQSIRSSSVQPESQSELAASPPDIQNARLLENSLWMALQYGDEYMDENPLKGEPGQFKFTTTTSVISRRRAEEEEAEIQARLKKDASNQPQTSSPVKPAAASPPAVFSEAKSGAKPEKISKEERRMSKMGDKVKRRKSRPGASGLSPTTPSNTASPAA